MAAMDSGSTNGRMATVSSGALALPTLLGRSAMRIPSGGRIRAGIKVLTRKAEEVGEARIRKVGHGLPPEGAKLFQ